MNGVGSVTEQKQVGFRKVRKFQLPQHLTTATSPVSTTLATGVRVENIFLFILGKQLPIE